jgi:hypothetical protein
MKTTPDEVQVLRFFEEGSLEKVEPVFNIVSAKMQERLRSEGRSVDERPEAQRRRRRASAAESVPSPRQIENT